jgi:NDP-sugar pyrophosphorylase family protein
MVSSNIFEGFEPNDSSFSFEVDFLPAITKNGSKITGCAFEATFFDIGVPNDYFMFCESMAQSN